MFIYLFCNFGDARGDDWTRLEGIELCVEAPGGGAGGGRT